MSRISSAPFDSRVPNLKRSMDPTIPYFSTNDETNSPLYVRYNNVNNFSKYVSSSMDISDLQISLISKEVCSYLLRKRWFIKSLIFLFYSRVWIWICLLQAISYANALYLIYISFFFHLLNTSVYSMELSASKISSNKY